ncbi:disintegrin and metalloproteinase domain-containing protein 12-like isoform X2 [Mya arenaria]|uniref:disintegrin and metalloproteinase domain-containing protein 12-like isoform X2 n=1 Tax=Mya arenaria TaxID=6604 RepID=UPI0022DEBF57|nr:disintegrin and metalloproteinase domain-containing protein 12-like isoform X2 [Mya arenaria]
MKTNLYYYFVFTQLFVIIYSYKTNEFNKGKVKHKPLVTEFSQHEVVYPRLFKDETEIPMIKNEYGHPKELDIHLVTSDGPLILHLIRNSKLFTKAYVEKTYTDQDNYRLKKPLHRKLAAHCFYHGTVVGDPSSMVAVSTCEGVSGHIQTSQHVYHIEPARDVDKVAHQLYRQGRGTSTPFKCDSSTEGHSMQHEPVQTDWENSVLRRSRRSVHEPYDADGGSRYVEMYIVNDFRTFQSNGKNEAYQIRKTQNIVNIVSRLYRSLNIYVALVGIENWTAGDRFTITEQADETLENFLHYRRERINPVHPHDNAQLITETSFTNGVVGKAIKGTICTFQYSGGVNLNLATEGQTATTIAHELGHNFGMDHDNYTICQCPDEKCIMAATSGGINTPTKWSSCSVLAKQEAFEMGMDYCLHNIPETLYEGPVCGNGFLETGEECDCGARSDCSNKCCNGTTCKLTSGSQCASGKCCDLETCKPKEPATLCRDAHGECDLPEFCGGSSPHCPADVFLQDGTDCGGGQSYCYKGNCRTHTGQCKLLWGSTGRVSDPVCFKHLNTNGSKHGNCGYNWTTSRYTPCLRDNVMCGLLHCVHQNEKLMFWKDSLTHATPATFLTIGTTTHVCRAAMLDVGLDMPDPGMVPDGAKCDERKMCVDHKCQAISQLNISACPEGCNDRGVCNSKGHCHCEEGWAPPLCDEAGNGGSVDSGPIKISGSNGLLIAMLVLFLVIVPLILFFIGYYFRDRLIGWWRKFNSKHAKDHSRPLRPAHPPPKRDPPSLHRPPAPSAPRAEPPPPSYKDAVKFNARPKPKGTAGVQISNPVLTGSTHEESKSHVQPSPVADHRPIPRPPPPKLPTKAGKQDKAKSSNDQSVSKNTEIDSKPKFGQMFKIPSFSKSEKQESPKPVQKIVSNQEEPSTVKKRELTRNISNPVLISTTDRRSKHLVKLDSLNVNQPPPAEDSSSSLAPALPPHVSLQRSESDIARRNRPLPPRPMSMPDSECGDEPEISFATQERKSVNMSSNSPRMPQRPPPPPVKPNSNIDSTRRTIEETLAQLDDINMSIPDSPDPNAARKAAHPKAKDIKPKTSARPDAKKSLSDSPKPKPPVKSTVGKAKSDPKKDAKAAKPLLSDNTKPASKWDKDINVKRPIFNPKGRPGLHDSTKPSQVKKSAMANSQTKASEIPHRKPSTDSLDDDPAGGTASVAGISKMFEGQKKPLLADKGAKKSLSTGANKIPMTPPKPKHGVKQVRSVDV